MLELDETIGTAGNDNLTAGFFEIAYGLQGNDTLRSGSDNGFSVLVGGSGNDLYQIRFGEVATIYDTLGVDAAVISGIPFSSDNSYVAQIQGRHLVAANLTTETTVYWIDFRTSSVGQIILDDITLTRDSLATSLTTLPNYLGNFSWQEIAPDTANVLNNRTFDATFPAVVARSAELEASITDTLSVEDARFVVYLYEAALDRNGNIDLEGVNFWIDRREDGLSVRELAGRLVNSIEFTESFGPINSFDARSFVEVLYRNVLNREGEAGGVDFWTGRLAQSDFDRLDAVVAFAGSAENRTGSAFVEAFDEVEPGFWAFS